jgi:pteridine reductase
LSDLTALAAVELAPHFRVNAIAPGWILDPVGEVLDPTGRQLRLKDIPLQKPGDVGDIINAMNYLVHSEFIIRRHLT